MPTAEPVAWSSGSERSTEGSSVPPGSASTTIMSRAGCMRKAQALLSHEGDLHGPNGVGRYVDVGIDHDHDLGQHVGGHGGQQGGARLAAKCWFSAMTMRKATPPEDGTATFSRAGNCSCMRLRKLAFVKRAASGCGSRSAAIPSPIPVSSAWKTAPFLYAMAVTPAIGPWRGVGAAEV
jgi:hypothetical protein